MKANLDINTGGESPVKPFLRRSKVVFQRLILVAVIALAMLTVTACNNSSADPNSEVVAKVGSREIALKQVDSVIKQQIEENGGATFTPAELVAARLSALDGLIQDEALFQKAQKENLVPDDNKVTQELQKLKQDRQLTEEQYQEQLKQMGITEEEARDQIRRSLAIAALRDKENTRVSAPTDAEIQSYYNERKEQFVAERGVDISIIVADPANNGARDDAIGDAAAEAKIKTIYEQLKSGTADFATIAAQRSEHASARQSGNLGFGSEAALRQLFPSRPEVAQRLLTMTPGQYTEPIKDNLGGQWVIFKLNGKREQQQNLTLEDVRKSIVDGLTQQRQQVLLKALVSVALSEANVKNYLAERIVSDPKRIVELRPSALIEQARQKVQSQQPQQRIENQPAPNANQSAPANANRATGANSNRGAATPNANR